MDSPEYMESLPPTSCGTRNVNYVNTEHLNNAFITMNEMRKSDQLCDISLEVSGAEIKAHKIVLASTSAYFNAMFNSKQYTVAAFFFRYH